MTAHNSMLKRKWNSGYILLVPRLETMGKKYQKANAARARQAQQQKHAPTVTNASVFQRTLDSNENGPTDVPKPIVLDFSSVDSECEYTSGVDVNDTSDDEYEGSEEEMWSSENNLDHSLIELEGKELDKNLQVLQVEVEAEIAQLAGPTAFERISRPVSADEWKKA